MAKYNKGYVNANHYSQMSNNPSDLFDYTMTNIMDNFYNSAMNTATDGKFKAVCLSGKDTGDGTGAGTDVNDAVSAANYLTIIVRPLTDFGNILPDPRAFKQDGGEKISDIISLHSAVFSARSDYEFDVSNSIEFGQIVDCYFEKGSIRDSNFQTLRFSEPKGKMLDMTFQELQLVSGYQPLSSKFGNGGTTLLGDSSKNTGSNVSTNQKGSLNKHEFIVIHYNAGFGGIQSTLDYLNKQTNYGYHYMIDRDGTSRETCPPDKIVYHSVGNKTTNNYNSIGVSLMNVGFEREGVKAKDDWVTGKYPNGSESLKWEPFSDASIKEAANVVSKLCKQYSIPVTNIVRHSDIQSNKSDPGPLFDLESFRMKVKGYLDYI